MTSCCSALMWSVQAVHATGAWVADMADMSCAWAGSRSGFVFGVEQPEAVIKSARAREGYFFGAQTMAHCSGWDVEWAVGRKRLAGGWVCCGAIIPGGLGGEAFRGMVGFLFGLWVCGGFEPSVLPGGSLI